MQIVSAVSPVELYLSNKKQFIELSQSISLQANKDAENGDFVHPVIVGDLVLALANGNWSRAEIVDVLPDNCYRVYLFDFAETTVVELNDICKATRELMEFPVPVTKCALESFSGAEDENQMDLVKEKMKSVLTELTVQGEVLEEKDDVTMVRIPVLEEKLRERKPVPALSARQELLRKLKEKRSQEKKI